MKGLFYKEARCLWHFGKTYLLMLVIFLGLALYQSTDSSGGAVWMLYPIFFAGALPASLIGDDEKSGWLTYCDTLPVTRRQIVTVKYITCLVTAAAVCLLAVPVVLLRHDTVAAMPFLAMMAPVGLIVPSVMLPTTYKLGATKGRVVYIVMLMVVAATCAVLMAIGLGLCTPLLTLIHTPENILADSRLYLRIYVLGLPFVFFYNVATGIFSALGDSKTPFIFLACSSTSNIAVDILFVTAFNMGVAVLPGRRFCARESAACWRLWLSSAALRKSRRKEK